MDDLLLASYSRIGLEMADDFEKYHLEKVKKVIEEINSKLGKQTVYLKISRIEEHNAGTLPKYLEPDEYLGKMSMLEITSKESKAHIDIVMPNGIDKFLTVGFYRPSDIVGFTKEIYKNFSEYYIKALISYMLNDFKRSSAPSLKVLRERSEIKKEIKNLSIIGAIISLLLMFKFGFLTGMIIFILILLFVNLYYPKLDIRS